MAQTLGLPELYQQFLTLAYGIWRKRWYMLVSAWVVGLMGWALVSTMPYKYTATAQVFVDTETLLPVIAKNLGINVNVTRQVDLVRRTLVTRPNLEKIIRRSDYLDRLARTDKDMDELVAYMQRNIRVLSLDGGMFRIEFAIDDGRLSDRQRAEVSKVVVTNLLAFFFERNTEEGQLKAEGAVDFLDQQIGNYSRQLEDAERAHAQFKQDNLEYLGGQGSFLSKLETAQTNLRRTRNQISELSVTVETLQKQLENVPPTIREPTTSLGGRRGGAKDPLEVRIEDLQKKYDNLKSLGMKEQHPDVQNVRRQIAALEEELEQKRQQIQQELADSANSGATSTATTETPNRLYEQLMLELINKKTEMATLEKRSQEQTRLVADMEQKAKRVPEIEAQEKQLKRDYQTIRRQYTELVQEKQDLDLRTDVEGTDQAVSLRVVEQPVTPQFPSGPPRLLYLTAVLVGALLAGVAVALIVSQLRPVVVTVEQLRSHFDMPVLGNVTRALSEEDIRRRNMDLLAFAFMSVALLMVYGLFVALDIFGSPQFG
ncbi:XrtA system polysaccharide chain length determinant [Eilatimonas milleporae]|uniref:Polysaccharide chain length determinant protein (PEP-CTERM system associated) n=1 Tax=Eilatimonas milleporae TaxID=911205 RepID=A0A3M0CY28_9PROT|nr:XrtA system polysaccharide chain length determinant [Eilatimonas milleporae]RMB08923.1 polysaccharide chain length determinant protein (PEP-CTERM system associated) [Eilatimonas milleporae]